MNNQEYQKFVENCASPKYDEKLAIIGLMGEVGELADVVKKSQIYAKYDASIRDKIVDEAGDVMWQLTLVLSKYGTTIDEIIDHNVAKLTARHGGERTAEDGGKR